MKRVGIYTGTFDPVHDGHLSFAREAAAECEIDKVFFLVEPRPRRKQGVKALTHRQHMVHLAVAEYENLGSIVLEQKRFSVIDTMPILQARFKGAELYLLAGDDIFSHLADWPNVEKLIGAVHFIIGLRNRSSNAVKGHITVIEKTKGVSIHYTILSTPLSSISSSRIRGAVKAGKHPKGLPASVAQYISSNNLYADASSGKTE